jgi:hypothetical protein
MAEVSSRKSAVSWSTSLNDNNQNGSQFENHSKPPYLPNLPKKLLATRHLQTETRIINGVFLNQDDFNNLKFKEDDVKPITLGGDLLKASQILKAINSNSMSQTVKHAKTCIALIFFY